MLNITIIEKRPVLCLGIKYFLERKIKEVYIQDFASIGNYFLSNSTLSADLIFIGVEGKGSADIPMVQRISNLRKNSGNIRIIIYDNDADIEGCIKYLRAGAHGYLSKTSDYATMERCLETVLEGKIFIDPVYQRNLLEGVINGKWHTPKRASTSKGSLTSRQNEIALLFAEGMSTSRIAQKLGLKASTISTVKSTIYAKLKVDSIVDLSKKVALGDWPLQVPGK